MVEIAVVNDKCFALTERGCVCLDDDSQCGKCCPFYKPAGCEDWVKVEIDGEVWLIPPEENERRFDREADSEKRKLYWRVKQVPKGKR